MLDYQEDEFRQFTDELGIGITINFDETPMTLMVGDVKCR